MFAETPEKDRRVEVEAAPAGDEGEEGEVIEVVQEDQWVLPDDRLVFYNFIVGGFCRLHDLKFFNFSSREDADFIDPPRQEAQRRHPFLGQRLVLNL